MGSILWQNVATATRITVMCRSSALADEATSPASSIAGPPTTERGLVCAIPRSKVCTCVPRFCRSNSQLTHYFCGHSEWLDHRISINNMILDAPKISSQKCAKRRALVIIFPPSLPSSLNRCIFTCFHVAPNRSSFVATQDTSLLLLLRHLLSIEVDKLSVALWRSGCNLPK